MANNFKKRAIIATVVFVIANAAIFLIERRSLDFSTNKRLKLDAFEVTCKYPKKSKHKLVIHSDGAEYASPYVLQDCNEISRKVKANNSLVIELHLGKIDRVVSIRNEKNVVVSVDIYTKLVVSMYRIARITLGLGFIVWIINIYIRRNWGNLR